MSWVLFADRASFDAYHNAACAEHGIPKPGKAQHNDEVMLEDTWTQAWVNITGAFAAPPDSFLLVNVPAEDVTTYGLTVAPADPVFPTPEDDNGGRITIFYKNRDRVVLSDVAADWMQPIPPTWTDPDTGDEHPVPPHMQG